jgi:O-methyltransferase
MMKKLMKFFGVASTPYFLFGVRQLLKITAGMPKELALAEAMYFVKSCEVQGDYLEFGVFQGRAFSAACFLARERRLKMQFWAFDSFEGLPSSEGEFQLGKYNCSQESFLRNVKKCVKDLSGIHVVPGWFDKTLVKDNPLLKALGPAAVVWVDCDLYESTVPVLDFLTDRLQDGSLIYFDDWFCFKGRPDFGEQRACREWLVRNPHIQLMPYSRFGCFGQSFIVHFTPPGVSA